MTTQFDSIYSGLLTSPGKLRIAASGLGWKSSDEKIPVITIPADEIKSLQSIRVARNYQLKILTSKSVQTFDGFVKEDLERLTNVCKQYYNCTIEVKEITVKGWNWGEVEVQSNDLALLVSSKPAFTLPLSLLSNSVLSGKNEVVLDFNSSIPPLSKEAEAEEDNVTRKKRLRALPDEVVEMRFYIPGSAKGLNKRKEKKVKAKKEEGEDAEMKDVEDEESSSEEEEEDGEESAAKVFYDAVKERSDMGQDMGEMIGFIPELLFMTPRGRFDLEIYHDLIRLKGKTYDYRINHASVQKLFLVPKPDEIHSQFVINIDPPIRQGQTRYSYLVMQFMVEEQLPLELTIDEKTRETFGEDLKEKYDDPAHEVVAHVIKTLTKKKVVTPGNYQSKEGYSAIKCMLKTNEGQLYFLDKQLLFISKIPTVILFADISTVTFSRAGGALPSSRVFDLSIKFKSAANLDGITFTSFAKEELESIEEYLLMKKIRVKNETEDVAAPELIAALESDDDDDAGDSDADDGPKKVKAAGGDLREEDDEDSEVDEDFQASSSDSDSGGSEEDSDDGDAMEVDGAKSKKKGGEPEKKKQKTG